MLSTQHKPVRPPSSQSNLVESFEEVELIKTVFRLKFCIARTLGLVLLYVRSGDVMDTIKSHTSLWAGNTQCIGD